MFDTNKIQRINTLLESMPKKFDDVYVVHEGIFIKESATLFKRLKIPVRAIMYDFPAGKELFGLPIIKTAQATENFNERTAVIILAKKTVPFIQTTFDFKVKGGTWTIPAFVMTNEEALAVYDRVMVEKLRQLYHEDGFDVNDLVKLSERFSRGLTTLLRSQLDNFKFQLYDSRVYFKPIYTFNDTAIVIQGPIAYYNNYTVETFKLYRSIYPNVPIVVSTWIGEATNSFRKECRENSIVLLENEPPKDPDPANIALQLKSSLQGVRYVKENTSAKFVLKTRTDQRINYSSFLVYFKNLLKTFPPKGDKLRERIIFLGGFSTRINPFSPQDFLSFGHVEDIAKLYDIPFNDPEGKRNYFCNHYKRADKINKILNSPSCRFEYNLVTEPSHKLYKLNKMMNRIYWAEMYIARTFYEKYIAPVDATKLYETSWKFTVDYLILIDFDTIKLDWQKYEHMRYMPKFGYDDEFAFARWLDMYRNFKIDWV